MNDFFEPPPPPPPRPPAERHPPWLAAPRGTLPSIVPLELVLAQTARFAICISHLAVYPTGFAFDIFVFAAPGQDEFELPDPMLFGPARLRARQGGSELPEDMLRIGVQFSDGRKATNLAGLPPRPYETPDGPVLHTGGGGGGNGQWHMSAWVWPLPPPGPIAFVCEWPAAGIPLTRREIDAQVILDAAARAPVIYPNGS